MKALKNQCRIFLNFLSVERNPKWRQFLQKVSAPNILASSASLDWHKGLGQRNTSNSKRGPKSLVFVYSRSCAVIL